jgi:bacterial translation initiation factor 2 (bIF-2)
MTDVTVKALATQLNTPVDRLVQQLADAGIRKSDNDSVTQEEQDTLRAHQKKYSVQ